MAKKATPMEEVVSEGTLNQIVYIETKRPDGSLRIQQDFQFCPSLAEQHTAHLSDLNYLVEKYKPDELAAYITARAMHRREVLGVDFSIEPSLQDAKNMVYQIQQEYQKLPEEIRNQFKNHLEFLKFIDNPLNQEKMIKMGLLKPQQIEKLTGEPVNKPGDSANADAGEGQAKPKEQASPKKNPPE